jgi:uncharacterized protein (TIGR00725 family)
MRINISVLGSEKAGGDVVKIAEELGREIARAGAVLICGGRGGVMRAAAKGCKEAGGLTVGILPSLDKSQANEFLDVVLPTSMGYGRNIFVASAADVVIAIDGNYGTLSEIAFALNYEKPVIVLEGSGGTADFMKNSIYDIHSAKTPRGAVELALKLIK